MYITILNLAKSGKYKAYFEVFIRIIENISLMLIGLSIVRFLYLYDIYYFKISLIILGSVLVLNIFINKSYIIDWSDKAVNKITENYLLSIYESSRHSDKELNLSQFISGDINSIRKLSVFYEEIIPQFIEMIILFIILLFLSIKNLTVLFLVIPISILFMYLVSYFVKSYQKKVNIRRDRRYLNMSNKFMEDLHGMKSILMNNSGEYFQKVFNDKSEKHRKDLIFSLGISLPRSAMRIIIANLAIIIFSYMIWKNYIYTIDITEITLMLYINIYILVLTKKFSYANKQVNMIRPVLSRVLNMIKNHSYHENIGDINIENIEEIYIKNASFSYQNNLIFDNITCKFENKNFYNFVGENGAGKSTLIKLIKGQETLSKGNIYINGIDLNDINKIQLTKKISIIKKRDFIFSGTIKENLLLASYNKDFNFISEKLKSYGLMNFVNELPKKWDSFIGENGNLLSDGQKQQLIFSMHLLQDKSVYILDEATSSVNPENADIILRALKKLSKDKLIINISHRKMDIEYADKVVLLNDKKIDFIQYDELINNKEYLSLFNIYEKDDNYE